MSVTWIMVANASQAKFFTNDGPNRGLKLIKELIHPESREKTSNLVSDRSGAYGGPGHGAVGQPADPKHHEAERFALELSRELEEGRVNNAYDRLILVASAPFMGSSTTTCPGRSGASYRKASTRITPASPSRIWRDIWKATYSCSG